MSDVSLINIKKTFGEVRLFDNVNLEIKPGEFVVFVGPSGSGKSTLLRMVAGLEDVTDGEISIGGCDVTYEEPSRRGIAMVFQNYALYPHMNVRGNIAFNLRLSKLPKAEIDKRIQEAAQILQLEEFLDRSPAQLSGGQRQRVAIGRAIVRHPKVFLFDEPLSNLDAALRVNMRLEIEKLHRKLGATIIYVTHDQTEAMTLADRIVALDYGEIQQVGTPQELYDKPDNKFVAGFIGSPKMNLVDAEIGKIDNAVAQILSADRMIGLYKVEGLNFNEGDRVTIGIRPEAFDIIDNDASPPADSLLVRGKVETVDRHGNISYVYVDAGFAELLTVQALPSVDFKTGDNLCLTTQNSALHVFDDAGLAVRRRYGNNNQQGG